MKKEKNRSGIGFAASVILFIGMLAILLVGTIRLAGSASEEGARTTQDAIERATVLCYATEGYYPPGLDYIEKNYGVQIDHSRYVVRYEIFASNIMPSIRVVLK